MSSEDGDPAARRALPAICKAAKIEAVTPHQLRDTYASQLLTSGVAIGYIAAQLGHASVNVTAASYAKWVSGDAYRRPIAPRDGEVPARSPRPPRGVPPESPQRADRLAKS